MARRLGWLGPVIALVGVAAAALGVWYMISARPRAGAVIETIAIDPSTSIVIRAEDGGDRSFVELHEGDKLTWQALIPPYAGRPGQPAVAWSDVAVSVRVVRDAKAEVFALSRHDASKLGGIHLATQHGAIDPAAPGPLTLSDHQRSYELVSGRDWHQITAIDLKLGQPLWVRELGAAPIQAAGLEGGLVWVEQGGKRRYFRAFTGAEDGTVAQPPKPA